MSNCVALVFSIGTILGPNGGAIGRREGRAMKDDSIELPTTSTPTGYVRATLAIPEHAVRVIASPPETLTQRNVEAVTGLSPRVYLEVIRTPAFPLRVAKLGKLRIVNRAAFVEWLEQRHDASSKNSAATSVSEIERETPNAIGSILDRVGLERTRELPKHRIRRRVR